MKICIVELWQDTDAQVYTFLHSDNAYKFCTEHIKDLFKDYEDDEDFEDEGEALEYFYDSCNQDLSKHSAEIWLFDKFGIRYYFQETQD